MDSSLVNHYAAMADKMQRDPISIDQGRATVAMGRGFAKWQRFNREDTLTWVNDINGVPRALTPKQLSVYIEMRERIDSMSTVRSIAETLSVSPSTVSRAAVKLASFGLIAYLIGRGRYGGILIIRRVSVSDGLERFRTAAKAKVREWAKAAERRISRLQSNVAPYLDERRRGTEVDSLYYYLTTVSKDATLDLPWTVEDMAEVS